MMKKLFLSFILILITVCSLAVYGCSGKTASAHVSEKEDKTVVENASNNNEQEFVIIEPKLIKDTAVFYADGIKVREISLNLFGVVDITKIVAYKSGYEFTGWNFTENFLADNPALIGITDALLYVKQNSGALKGLGRVELEAVFEPTSASFLKSQRTVAHALGEVYGETYQNVKEGFLTYYEKGQRFFEVDLSFSTDGYLVADHNHSKTPYTKSEYLSGLAEGKTRLAVEDVIVLLKEYEDIYLDIDLLSAIINKNNNEEEIETLTRAIDLIDGVIEQTNVSNLKDRIVLEVPSSIKDDVLTLYKAHGYSNFILIAYNGFPFYLEESFEESCAWCKDNGVYAVSCSTVNEVKMESAKTHGVEVYVFPYDDIKELYSFYDLGVLGIFTETLIV